MVIRNCHLACYLTAECRTNLIGRRPWGVRFLARRLRRRLEGPQRGHSGARSSHYSQVITRGSLTARHRSGGARGRRQTDARQGIGARLRCRRPAVSHASQSADLARDAALLTLTTHPPTLRRHNRVKETHILMNAKPAIKLKNQTRKPAC